MAGLKLMLPTRFTDTTLPTLKDDDILIKGSLLLIDPSHPAGKWTKTPAVGDKVANIATFEASALLGASKTDLEPLFGVSAGYTARSGKWERTPKGGFHGAMSQTQADDGAGFGFSFPMAIKQYLVSNPTNALYFSIWRKPTRTTSLAMGDRIWSIHNTSSPGNNYRAYTFSRNNPPHITDSVPDTAVKLGKANETSASSGAIRQSYGSRGWTGSVPATAASLAAEIGYGEYETPYEPSNTLGHQSGVLYRFYMEDLTVSKRTYEEVDAIDASLYSREVETSGGRYFGDTFTSPATLAP